MCSGSLETVLVGAKESSFWIGFGWINR